MRSRTLAVVRLRGRCHCSIPRGGCPSLVHTPVLVLRPFVSVSSFLFRSLAFDVGRPFLHCLRARLSMDDIQDAVD